MIRSLAGELKYAEIDAFLTAVDAVMNGNTLLLKVQLDSPARDCDEILRTFLRSPAFGEAMLEADRDRNWHNFVDPDSGQPHQRQQQQGHLWLVEDDYELRCMKLDPPQLQARFLTMLCHSFSPYGRRQNSQEAVGRVGAFIRRLLTPSPAEWCLHSVQPTFLWSTGYYTDRPDFGYFDGGENDSATLMHRSDIACLLLTNGSP